MNYTSPLSSPPLIKKPVEPSKKCWYIALCYNAISFNKSGEFFTITKPNCEFYACLWLKTFPILYIRQQAGILPFRRTHWVKITFIIQMKYCNNPKSISYRENIPLFSSNLSFLFRIVFKKTCYHHLMVSIGSFGFIW